LVSERQRAKTTPGKLNDPARGVIAIDNTLVDHAGELIADVGWFWDHANERHVIAHDYLISNYVCVSGAHYPIDWRRFKKRDTCEQEKFKDHTELCIELLDDAITRGIPGDFTFDSYFTSAKVLNHMASTKGAYVGDLKRNRKVVYEGREQSLQAVARQIPWQASQKTSAHGQPPVLVLQSTDAHSCG
jgi:hypothetical protein